MFVFNCTQAAADFLTVTRKGKKVTCLEPAPHKTIAESLETPVFPDDIPDDEKPEFQWHWLLHCVSVKRKKYLLVMDYKTRFCITLPAGKKGDQYEFLNAFDPLLRATYQCLAMESGVDEVEMQACVDAFNHEVNTCAFHKRGDRSVQGHLNEVVWHLERHCYEEEMLTDEADLIGFNIFTGKLLRKVKGEDDYFTPNQEFLRFWTDLFLLGKSKNKAMGKVINIQDFRK